MMTTILLGIVILGLLIICVWRLCVPTQTKNIEQENKHIDEHDLSIGIRAISSPTLYRVNDQAPTVDISCGGKIPKVIIQSDELDEVMIGSIIEKDTIINYNPDYHYKYYSDARVDKFIKKHSSEREYSAFKQLVPGAYKCDFFRVCYLYHKGGIYLDKGFTPTVSFNSVLKDYSFIVVEDNNGSSNDKVVLYNAFMAFEPNHPMLRTALDMMVYNIETKNYEAGALGITGPDLLGKAFCHHYGPVTHGYNSKHNFMVWKSIYFKHIDTSIISDQVTVEKNPIFYTKNMLHRLERKYHGKPHYSEYYTHRQVFGEPGVLDTFNRQSHKITKECLRVNRAPVREQTFYTVPVTKYRKGMNSLYHQTIPKIIVQTNLREDVPINMKKSMDHIMDINPEYDYYYFSDPDVEKFIQTEFPDYYPWYRKLIPGAYKADFFRLCFLLKHGGFYLDSAFYQVQPFRKFVKAQDEMIIPEDNDGTVREKCSFLYNAFMASIPNHPFIKACLEQFIENIKNKYVDKDSSLGITGPKMVGAVFDRLYGTKALEIKTYHNSDSNIRIIKHIASFDTKFMEYASYITDGEEYGGLPHILFHTRYMKYTDDRDKYYDKPHYSILYKKGQIYNV